MISIISTDNSQGIKYVENRLSCASLDKTSIISSIDTLPTYINTTVVYSNIVILIGDTFLLKQCISRTLELPLLYDKATNLLVKKFCENIEQDLPPQHIMDNHSCVIEGFVSLPSQYGMQCASIGQFKKTTIFVLPDNLLDIQNTYNNYIDKTIAKLYGATVVKEYKIYSLSKEEIEQRLAKVLNMRIVSHRCETTQYHDSTVSLRFVSNATKAQINATHRGILQVFGGYLYSTNNTTLAQELVSTLSTMHKTLAVAESLTGGLLASTIVDVAGASNVLLEGVVSYSIKSKQHRLNINPHMIDSYGVVSSQVATNMASSVMQQSGADYALSTTGYAGPIPQDNLPVGLCYISVCTNRGCDVYRMQYSGDRQNIRLQTVHSAMFLLLNTIKGVKL